MKFAKLDQSELLPTVQCVSFVDLVDSDTVKLMEVDKSILQHVVSGDRWGKVLFINSCFLFVYVPEMHVAFGGLWIWGICVFVDPAVVRSCLASLDHVIPSRRSQSNATRAETTRITASLAVSQFLKMLPEWASGVTKAIMLFCALLAKLTRCERRKPPTLCCWAQTAVCQLHWRRRTIPWFTRRYGRRGCVC